MTYVMPNRRPRRRFLIGIDPDKDNSGIAVYDRTLKTWLLHAALPFAQLQEVCFAYPADDTEIFLEAGWKNEGQHKYQLDPKKLPKDFDTWSRARREAYKFERGISVGINFGAGFAILHVLRANHYTVHEYCPKTAKWDAQLLRQITGITARTNEDTRDAIRAAYLNL